MNKDDYKRVKHHLRYYRSHKYAAENSYTEGDFSGGYRVPLTPTSDRMVTLDHWDYHRYARRVRYINGAVNDVLDDKQRMVIEKAYLNRDKMTFTEIARFMNVDPSTVSRYHKEALELLHVALAPLEHEEIHNLNFFLNEKKTA